jgi:hypothetical protein
LIRTRGASDEPVHGLDPAFENLEFRVSCYEAVEFRDFEGGCFSQYSRDDPGPKAGSSGGCDVLSW